MTGVSGGREASAAPQATKPRRTTMAKSKAKSKITKKADAPQMTLDAPTSIPLIQLALSDRNVRENVNLDGIRDLADSIKRRGLLQSLSVRPLEDNGAQSGKFEIQCGGRRYRALLQLVGQGVLSMDSLVPCIIKTSGVAADDSLAENSDREDLHPIDEFRAFASMKAAGLSDDDVAAAYKVTAAVVRQRLRLASASPKLLEAYRDEILDLQDLMAFCIVDDHGRQERVFKELSESHNLYVHAIKRKLTETDIQTTDKRVRFVGLDNYEAVGGPVLRDLFSERDEGYIQDADLLAQLVTDKLSGLKAFYEGLGWGTVIAAEDLSYDDKKSYRRLTPLLVEFTAEETERISKLEAEADLLAETEERTDEQDERYDALETELEELRNKPDTFTPEDMAKGVVFICIGYDGSPSIDLGYCKPADAPASVNNSTAEHHAAAGDEEGASPGKPLPERLVQDLTSYRTAALRNALSTDFQIAFVSVLHALCLKQFYDYAARRSCLQISMQNHFPSSVAGFSDWKATRDFNERDAVWKEKLPKEPELLWECLMGMASDLRNELFAHCTAATVNAVREQHIPRREEIQHANQLQMALGVHMDSAGWSTTADNFFGRVTKDHIIAAVREAKDDKHADLIAHLKKPEMAKEAERLIQGTGWLPVPLRMVDTPTDTDEMPDFLSVDEGDAEDALA